MAASYRALFERSPHAQVVVDANGVIELANARSGEFFGCGPDDLVGREIESLVPDWFRLIDGDHLPARDDAEATDGSRELVRGVLHDGTERLLGLDLCELVTPDGPATLAVITDEQHGVREHRQDETTRALHAELAARTAAHTESERRLRISLDAERNLLVESQEQQRRLDVSLRAAGMGTFEWDVVTNHVTFDERSGVIIGLDVDSLSAEQLLEVLEPTDRDRIIAAVRTAVDRGEPDDAVFRVGRHGVGAAAGPRWVHGWGQPVQGDDGAVRKLVGVLQDVTSEREERRLVEEREQRLQLVLDVTVSGVFDWDVAEGSITFSDSWYASIGIEPADLDTDDWDWERIVHPDDWPAMARHTRDLIDGTAVDYTFDLRLRSKEGSWRWARLAAQAVERDAHGRALRIIGADTDISAQRTMEQQLVHSAKMQSLGEFAGGIAHDFNNVMAIVRGHTEFLIRGDCDEADTTRRLTSIERAVDRASSLVGELMLLGRPSTDNPVVVDLTDHLRATASSWSTFLGDDIAIELDLDDEPVLVRIDASRLDALLLNLASNSRDALPEGGILRIAAQRRVDGDQQSAELTMSDDGVGIDPASLETLFEPFFTTKAPGVGTGLGLATTYTTVSQAGGTISAVSELGVGTTITISLPLAEAGASATVADTPVIGSGATGSGVTWPGSILVVEDEAEILQLNADVLRLAGHRVYEALNGEEALEILSGGADIDVMVTDVAMPEMSGPRLAARVRERWPQIRVLFVSGHAAPFGTDAIDPTRLLTKPISAAALTRAVSDALDEVG